VRRAPDVKAEREAVRGSRRPGIARHQAESVHEGVRYDIEVDTGVLGLDEEGSLIAEYLVGRWSIQMAARSKPRSTLPATSAWMPEGTVRPAPWER
jgi:hypothetical protein